MPKMKLRIHELMIEKGKRIGKELTQDKVAHDINVTPSTLGRLAKQRVDSWNISILERLYHYFECKNLEELIVVDSED